MKEIRRQKPRAVITDWGMPKVSGIELLQAMRRHEALKDLPVLMITCRSEKEYILAAAREKVRAYLVKPFALKALDMHRRKVLQ
jgi:two-component system chemotaxis response regulator CheY